MAEAYIIQVDMEQLRTRRSRIEQRELTDEDIRLWLAKYGFYPRVDGLYLAEKDLLEQLNPEDILDMRPVENVTL